MSSPRRRVLRNALTAAEDPQRQKKIVRRREKLQKEQEYLSKWMAKLKRAFHAVEKHQKTVARLERELTQLDQS